MAVRVYFAIHADIPGTPSEEQWQALINAVKAKPLATAVLQAAKAAQQFIQANKRSQGAGEVLKWTLAGFEIDNGDVDAIAAVVDAQSSVYGCTGSLPVRFICVLESELQEAATDLGYGAQAANLTIDWYTYGTRDEAIAAAQQYIADNSAIWHNG